MKFSCEKSFLQNAINTTSRATAAKSAVVALEGLLIEAGSFVSISGYNLKTGIRAEIPADVQDEGSIVLNSRLFGEIVRRFDDDIVTVESNENLIVKISCGMSEFEIMGISANDYPELPTVCLLYTSTASDRRHLKITADSSRLFKCRLLPGSGFLIPDDKMPCSEEKI